MSHLDILVPVLGRPHRVAPLLDSIAAATPQRYRVHFICTPGDTEELQAIDRDGRADILSHDGSYGQKINAAIRTTSGDLVFLAADDLAFRPGWLEAAAANLCDDETILAGAGKEMPLPGTHVVGVNDLIRRPRRPKHATHFLVSREYAERGQVDGQPGLLCETYRHNFIDDELIATATLRRVYTYAADSHVEHLHPMAMTAPDDRTYRRGRDFMRTDSKRFRGRKHLWAT